ncbi:hypothetical protein EI164_13920 [Psychrobacter sp. FME13]|uniref:hypothetical protein n=4 Tax=Psychrobacter TaxID=497 RepID=UPI0017880785|nr:hypothetical protein [Psychrobacter sp. FME13]MBE0443135.1 hypothetical protein [Psychrobacter sp. FME13]
MTAGVTFKYNDDYVVTYYGYLKKKDSRDNSQLLIKIAFLNISLANESGREYQSVLELPFNYILKMPIGSIWRNGICISRYYFPEMELTLNNENTKYQPEGLDVGKLRDRIVQNYSGLLTNSNLSIISTDFEDQSGEIQTLLIHPLIFFNANYGYSTEIKRVLLTSTWGNENFPELQGKRTVIGRCLLDKNNKDVENSVYLPSRFVKRDALLLHFLKTNAYAKTTVKDLVSNVHQQRMNEYGSEKIDLPVEPWHTDPIQAKCRVMRLDARTLLCIQITGMSEPNFLDDQNVIRVMLSPSFKNKLSDLADLEETLDGYYQPLTKRENVEDIDLNPDYHVNNLEVAVVKECLEILGERWILENYRQQSDRNDRGNMQAIYPPEANEFAVGDIANNRGDIGWLEIAFAPSTDTGKSRARLDKLWTHAKELREKVNGRVRAEWFTFGTGFNNEDDFTTMALSHKLLNPTKYPYEVLVIRVLIDNEIYYIIDSDARPDKEKKGMSGIVIKVTDEAYFLRPENENGLLSILIIVAQMEGSLSESYVDSFNGNMALFKHSKKRKNGLVEEGKKINWILNGINNINE